MAGIDFVPDDYIQRRESRRANFFYIALFALVFSVFLGNFGFLKVRQRALNARQASIDSQMKKAQQQIAQLETLQLQRQEMIKTALLTADLIEPIPRSVLLAMLANSMPDELSLSGVKLMQKKNNSSDIARYKSRYEAAKSSNTEDKAKEEFVTIVEIEGYAASDIAVADYIARLTNSILLDGVYLVHSKEYDMPAGAYRSFKLSAFLKNNIHLADEDIEEIINYSPKNLNSKLLGSINEQ